MDWACAHLCGEMGVQFASAKWFLGWEFLSCKVRELQGRPERPWNESEEEESVRPELDCFLTAEWAIDTDAWANEWMNEWMPEGSYVFLLGRVLRISRIYVTKVRIQKDFLHDDKSSPENTSFSLPCCSCSELMNERMSVQEVKSIEHMNRLQVEVSWKLINYDMIFLVT